MSSEIDMRISPVCSKDGKTFAYVLFSDGAHEAEGKIPDCKIVSNKGFTDEEVSQLETYLKKELANLKKKAAEINPLGVLMGKYEDKK